MTSDYSWLDRMFHHVAFSSPSVQLSAADVERTLYGRRFDALKVNAPVFLTSLPRAGTTLILEALATVPSLATYSYRDMPFVLAPLLWETLSKSFRKPSQLKERAHGDGMAVGYDSPEAFEEVLWRFFWPERFGARGIELWSERDEASEFRAALVSQMQRIIAVRSTGGVPRRYLSKNNGNVARIALLRKLFADAVILVPFRDPLEQAGSLLTQHLRFLERHRQDPWAKRYMRDIGHLEFGELHRPFRFDGVDDVCATYRPDTLDYWLAYWTCAFKAVLQRRDDILLVSYDTLCGRGTEGLRVMASRLAIPDHPDAFDSVTLHPPSRSKGRGAAVAPGLLEEAAAVHDRLMESSIL